MAFRDFVITARANSALRQYRTTHNLQDLQQAIKLWRAAIDNVSGFDNDIQSNNTEQLALCHQLYYEHTRQQQAYDEMVKAYVEAAQLISPTNPMWVRRTYNAAVCLSERSERYHQPEDQYHTIQLYQTIREKSQVDSESYPLALNNLSVELGKCYKRTGNEDLLFEALVVSQQACDLLARDSPQYPLAIGSQAAILHDLYNIDHDTNHLEKAIQMNHQAIAMLSESTSIYPGVYSNLSTVYMSRYMSSGDAEDLSQARIRLEHAMTMTQHKEHPMRLRIATNLGAVYLECYQRFGQADDLIEALRLCQLAEVESSANDLFRPIYVANFAVAFSIKAIRMGMLDDMRRAISVIKQALENTEMNAPVRPVLLNNLGLCFHELALCGGDLENLTKAVEAYREASLAKPQSGYKWLERRNNLSTGLRDMAEYLHRTEALADAIKIWQELQQNINISGSLKVMVYTNLSVALADYARQSGQPQVIGEAVSLSKHCLQMISAGDTMFPAVMNNWGWVLRSQARLLNNNANYAEATIAYRQVCQTGMEKAPQEVLRSACRWGAWALECSDWKTAAEAYTYGVEAQRRLYETQLLPGDRRQWLAAAPELHANAAYAFARCGDMQQAVVTLEHGRARELSTALSRDRTNMSFLAQTKPELVARYHTTVEQLRMWQMSDVRRTAESTGIDPDDEIHSIMAELRSIIAEIQTIPGHHNFLQPTSWDEVTQAVHTNKPIVYVLGTPVGGLALIVSRRTDDTSAVVTPRWLDQLTTTCLQDLVSGEQDRTVIHSWLDRYQDITSRSERRAKAIDHVGPRLWEVGFGSLMDTLAGELISSAYIIPSGLLTVLPLHLAWKEEHDRRQYILDRFEISVMPSARLLGQFYTNTRDDLPDRLLAIQDPQPVNQKPLLATAVEVQSICQFFSEGTILASTEASHTAVISALPQADIIHFACHGGANWQQPDQVGLVLAHNQWFTMEDLYQLHLPNARLVILSACESGVVYPELPDEVIAFPWSFVHAGSDGVIASLWAVPDTSTAMLMERFYRYWREDGLAPAQALRAAQHWLRDTSTADKRTYYDNHIAQLPSNFGENDHLIKTMRAFLVELQLQDDGYAMAHPYYWGAFQYIGV